MLKASALFYAIIISVLAALLSGSLILSVYFSRLETDTYVMRDRLQHNAVSGIELLLSSQEEVREGEPVTIDLYNSGEDSVRLEKRSWGVYEMLSSCARWKQHEIKLSALAGGAIYRERFALYLADQDRPLSLAGNTVIRGDAYLPKAGVQHAYIEGQSYAGEKMIYGNMLPSAKTIPTFDQQLAGSLKDILSGNVQLQYSVIAMPAEDSLVHSFTGAPLIIYSSQEIILVNKYISGYIMIISGKEIVVNKNTMLDNVLLAAPIIRIEDEFEGTLQAFASDTLLVGKDCRLDYPSALGIIRTVRSPDQMILSLGEETKVKGTVLGWQDSYDIRKNLLVSIGKECEITGQVYSNGLLDMQGAVNGNVTASRFLLRTPSSVYENHLLNAVIDITKLPSYFGGPVMEKGNRRILKWIQ
jgi:hypothetical protein